MKVIQINAQFFYYPPEFNNINEFIDFLNKNKNGFIPLTQLIERGCVEPYFIKEEVKTIYFNVARIYTVNEAEITVLTQKEYNQRLKDVVNSKCVCCKNFIDDGGYNIESHADYISLDGECIYFDEAEGAVG